MSSLAQQQQHSSSPDRMTAAMQAATAVANAMNRSETSVALTLNVDACSHVMHSIRHAFQAADGLPSDVVITPDQNNARKVELSWRGRGGMYWE